MMTYIMTVLKDDGTRDTRYTYNATNNSTFTPLFCGVVIGATSSINKAVLTAKRHQTGQVLGVYL